jgi:hypothetical protein
MFAVRIAASAEQDVRDGREFYDRQEPGLGEYFLDCLISDIDALAWYAGLHPKPVADFHRALSKRFPFAIYYDFDGHTAIVVAVLDCRRNPASLGSTLTARRPA